MRTFFVGDVHSCADELQELVARAAPDRLILVGDVFNKGPLPGKTWELVKALSAELVLGNHDLALMRRPVAHGRRRLPAAALPWLAAAPLFLRGKGGPSGRWICVHAGLHPTLHAKGTTRRMALNLRRFPDDPPSGEPPSGRAGAGPASPPFWWELYDGRRMVIYGHDAMRGLQDRRPSTLGLDTGCVYGGRLTGYLLEDDQLLSVAAREVYSPVGGSGRG